MINASKNCVSWPSSHHKNDLQVWPASSRFGGRAPGDIGGWRCFISVGVVVEKLCIICNNCDIMTCVLIGIYNE